MEDRLSLLGAGSVYTDGSLFGCLNYDWPLLRLTLNREGGRLQVSESKVLPLLTKSIGGVAPDISFRWPEVDNVELIPKKLVLFGRGVIAFRLIARARGSGRGDFEFSPMGVTN